MFKTILAAVDCSSQRGVVLEQAADIAGRFDATLHVVAVRDLLQHTELLAADPNPEILSALDAEDDALLADIDNELARNGITCRVHQAKGDVVEEIVLMVDEIHADLIVIGHRHLSWLRRLVERSVGADLLRLAPCSVLVAVGPERQTVGAAR
jgi:nucleotide-binding universal stress UspA family protein